MAALARAAAFARVAALARIAPLALVGALALVACAPRSAWLEGTRSVRLDVASEVAHGPVSRGVFGGATTLEALLHDAARDALGARGVRTDAGAPRRLLLTVTELDATMLPSARTVRLAIRARFDAPPAAPVEWTRGPQNLRVHGPPSGRDLAPFLHEAVRRLLDAGPPATGSPH